MKIISHHWLACRRQEIYNIFKVLAAASIWALFEVMGVFHSLIADNAWTISDLQAFMAGDKGRIISLFGVLALLVIHSVEIYVCRDSIKSVNIKHIKNGCFLIFGVFVSLFFDFGNEIDVFLLCLVLAASFFIKAILFFECRKKAEQ